MDNDRLIILLLGTLCGFATLIAVAGFAVGTIFKLPFGINLGSAQCAECDEKAPTLRKPADLYEMLWGGWTCEQCGCKNDKWGNARQGKRRRKKRRDDDDDN